MENDEYGKTSTMSTVGRSTSWNGSISPDHRLTLLSFSLVDRVPTESATQRGWTRTTGLSDDTSWRRLTVVDQQHGGFDGHDATRQR